MKKLFYLLLIIIIFPLNVKASNTYIDNYYIDIVLEEDGDALVKELFTYKGKFNGAIKKLTYETFSNNLSNIDATLYSPTNIKLIDIKEIKVDNNINFNYVFNEGISFTRNDNATTGSYGYYSVTTGYKEYTYKIFNPGTYKGFYIEYVLENVVVNHQDISELWLNILRQNDDGIKHLEIVVNLPNNIEVLRAWAHGPLNGDIDIQNNQKVLFAVDNFSKGESIDVRLAFDNCVNSSKKTTNVMLDNIIKYETILAEEANEKREQIREELERYEKEQKRKATIFYILSSIWTVGLFFLIKFIYKNYDKEYLNEFKGKYFRDIPNNNNPAFVGYLINKKIRTEDLSAIILNLINNKKIEFVKLDKNDYQFNLINDYDIDEIERLALALLFNNQKEVKLSEFKKRAKKSYDDFLTKYNKWYKKALNEAAKKKYFEEKVKAKIFSILYSVLGIMLLSLHNEYINSFVFLMVAILSFVSFIYFVSYSKRTKKGNEEYLKWIGLKNFMNDFGKMDIKELPEVKLWEKYLVYAVTLGCASKLIKTMKIKIKELNTIDSNIDTISFNNNLFLITNMNKSVTTSINSALSQAKSIASSRNSSGGGYGGGFSSGGGFSGGGGGSAGHF